MKYLLDTNICIYIIKQKPPIVLETLKQHKPEEISISAITAFELMYGAYKSAMVDRNLEALDLFLNPFSIIDYSLADAIISGEIRSKLERHGKDIGPYDLLIAAQAINNDLTLVTNNVKEFSRVENLKHENWTV